MQRHASARHFAGMRLLVGRSKISPTSLLAQAGASSGALRALKKSLMPPLARAGQGVRGGIIVGRCIMATSYLRR